MRATISKNLYTNKYIVKKWDYENNIIKTFSTKKKHLASKIFTDWYFDRD